MEDDNDLENDPANLPSNSDLIALLSSSLKQENSNIALEIISRITEIKEQRQIIDTLPDANKLKVLEEAYPGFIKDFVERSHIEQDHRHDMDHKQLDMTDRLLSARTKSKNYVDKVQVWFEDILKAIILIGGIAIVIIVDDVAFKIIGAGFSLLSFVESILGVISKFYPKKDEIDDDTKNEIADLVAKKIEQEKRK